MFIKMEPQFVREVTHFGLVALIVFACLYAGSAYAGATGGLAEVATRVTAGFRALAKLITAKAYVA